MSQVVLNVRNFTHRLDLGSVEVDDPHGDVWTIAGRDDGHGVAPRHARIVRDAAGAFRLERLAADAGLKVDGVDVAPAGLGVAQRGRVGIGNTEFLPVLARRCAGI
ncbi:MAG: hypothetical protein QM811_08035 [Pirellulales bacterium]